MEALDAALKPPDPLNPQKNRPKRHHAMTLTPRGHSRRRILIVDDQLANISLLSTCCRTRATPVSSTLDPQEVCALHRQERRTT
jgi:PleD family two-component response regulator